MLHGRKRGWNPALVICVAWGLAVTAGVVVMATHPAPAPPPMFLVAFALTTALAVWVVSRVAVGEYQARRDARETAALRERLKAVGQGLGIGAAADADARLAGLRELLAREGAEKPDGREGEVASAARGGSRAEIGGAGFARYVIEDTARAGREAVEHALREDEDAQAGRSSKGPGEPERVGPEDPPTARSGSRSTWPRSSS